MSTRPSGTTPRTVLSVVTVLSLSLLAGLEASAFAQGIAVSAPQVVTAPGDAAADPPGDAANEPRQLFVASGRQGHAASVQALNFTPDGRRLCSGGHDKRTLVWDWKTGKAVATHRWLAEEGLFGAVRAVRAFDRPDGTTAVMIGGYGGTDRIGDLQWVDLNGIEEQPLHYEPSGPNGAAALGHRAVVHALAVSPSGGRSASIDDAGRVLVRSHAPFGPARELRPSLPQRLIRWSAAFVGETQVVVPAPGPAANAWRLSLLNAAGDAAAGPAATEIALPGGAFEVTALASAPAGDRFAAAYVDAAGRPRAQVWTRIGAAWTPAELPAPPGFALFSLAFSKDGERLAAAGETFDQTAGAALVWDVPTRRVGLDVGKVIGSLLPASCCALSPDGGTLAFSQGTDIALWNVNRRAETRTLTGGARLDHVAFDPKADPTAPYAVIARTAGARGTPSSSFRFSPEQQTLDQVATPPAAARPGQALAEALPLDRYAGELTCFRLVPPARGRTAPAIAVGTSTGVLFVHAADGSGRLLRTFWGHQDQVNDVALSADGRYLASVSDDGTVRYWSLEELPDPGAPAGDADAAIKRLWGMELERVPGEDGVRVTSLAENAYLHRKGIRATDRLSVVASVREGAGQFRSFIEVQAGTANVPWHEQMNWRFERGGEPLPSSTRVARPVFMPTLTLTVDRNPADGWVAYHPDGYFMYAGSGANNIGWQENRRTGSIPSFLPFASLAERFLRPKAVAGLLEAGNWLDAVRATEEVVQLQMDAVEPAPPQPEAVQSEVVQPEVVDPVDPPPIRTRRPRINMVRELTVGGADPVVPLVAEITDPEGGGVENWSVQDETRTVVAEESLDAARPTVKIERTLPFPRNESDKRFLLRAETDDDRRGYEEFFVRRQLPIEAVVPSADFGLEWLAPTVAAGGGAAPKVVNDLDLPVKVRVRARNKQPIATVRFRVNGRYGSVSTEFVPDADGAAGLCTATLRLAPGENRIVVEVESGVALIPLTERGITVRAEKVAPVEYPTLWVIAAGVEQYHPTLGSLSLAVDDAERVARFYLDTGQKALAEGQRYGRVDVALLADATPDGMSKAWTRVAGAVRRGDTVLFLFSGHGMRAAADDPEEFYLMLAGASNDDFSNNVLPGSELLSRAVDVQQKACQVVMFIDACHSGALLSSASLDLNSLAGTAGAKTGIAVLCSSSGKAFSYEGAGEIQNGLFTWALASVLDGSAASPPAGLPTLEKFKMRLQAGDEISLEDVRRYVISMVPALYDRQNVGSATGRQVPVFYDMSGVDSTRIILSRW
ncbi:caspase family protein [Alienimonas chondri]|uniref:Peptidase C14 caspase domain-containing protein n=1 Tax=Alienimonas chondri TaxID=2681879 RepID=A0ABX1VFI6_9PLAN|nr:caspase family protein [Alienimonas chondri]NNJ26860.1 hypothetical protein [Alienimonas chondri]